MELAEKPMQFVRKQMTERSHEVSYVSTLLEGNSESTMGEDGYNVVKWSAASMYAGGTDTVSPVLSYGGSIVDEPARAYLYFALFTVLTIIQSVGVLSAFFLAMTLHPEVQCQAREEIDRIVGSARLPDFSDRESLPYIEAVVKECFRWHTLAPLAIPHQTTSDDVCEGYTIPKGAIILPNLWYVLYSTSYVQDISSMLTRYDLGGSRTIQTCIQCRTNSSRRDS